jgi:exopolyphosphatase/guanosine-5'-triphosphate,3'-diphosphate pyrophosphatase
MVTTLSDLKLVFALRLATLFHRSRSEIELPRMEVLLDEAECVLRIGHEWLERNPLTATAITAEAEEWSSLGLNLRIKDLSEGHKDKRVN